MIKHKHGFGTGFNAFFLPFIAQIDSSLVPTNSGNPELLNLRSQYILASVYFVSCMHVQVIIESILVLETLVAHLID